jgi:(S)-3,5-dihydroxyphenylglycine transaminase
VPIEAIEAPVTPDLASGGKGRAGRRLAVMRFLNEIADDHPGAISLASGRPADAFFEIDAWLEAIPRFQAHVAEALGTDAAAAGRRLAQYGRTGGMINGLVAGQLLNDEGLDCDPGRIVITAGCQEAIALCIQALCARPGDVVLARNPTYIGATGVADLLGVEIVPLEPHADGDAALALEATAARLAAQGKTARAFYVTPEFDNPTGTVMPLAEREALLAACRALRVVILEDNPYGMFRFDGEAEPHLAAMDRDGVVVYLGTYSKTLCPAVRVGCAAVPKRLFGDEAASAALVAELVERKSYSTVNTSQLNQALVGGVLLREGGTLRRIVEAPRLYYRRNRDLLLERLDTAFAGLESAVTWNRPRGGFFLSLSLPFPFGSADVVRCAAEYGFVVMPMSFFALDDSEQHRIRIAFSGVGPAELTTAIDSFGQYVRDRLRGN